MTTRSWCAVSAPGNYPRRTLRRLNSRGRWPSARSISMKTKPRLWSWSFSKLRRCSRKSDARSASTAARANLLVRVVGRGPSAATTAVRRACTARWPTDWLTHPQRCKSDVNQVALAASSKRRTSRVKLTLESVRGEKQGRLGRIRWIDEVITGSNYYKSWPDLSNGGSLR